MPNLLNIFMYFPSIEPFPINKRINLSKFSQVLFLFISNVLNYLDSSTVFAHSFRIALNFTYVHKSYCKTVHVLYDVL
jgi:hypothetical protein